MVVETVEVAGSKGKEASEVEDMVEAKEVATEEAVEATVEVASVVKVAVEVTVEVEVVSVVMEAVDMVAADDKVHPLSLFLFNIQHNTT